MTDKLEKMNDFFTARLDTYEEHMLSNGGYESYIKLAAQIPENTGRILDLGCGTGLELDEIYKRLPQVSVVGIDMTPVMLEKLRQKHPHREIELICGDYFNVRLGENTFDVAISAWTLHHFSYLQKIQLYTKIREALRPGGMYIELDYMAADQSFEDARYAANARLRRELDVPEGAFYHFDTPCTVDNQIAMLKQAGFITAEPENRWEHGAIIVSTRALCQK